jgi:uncharacterized OB-fold protein
MPARPAPTVTPDTEFFWTGLRAGQLLLQRCDECGRFRHPPRPMCPHCQSLAWSAVPAAGRGEVVSFVRPRHPRWPWFEGGYVVVLVELEEGVRVVSNLVEAAPDTVRTGMSVAVRFEHFDDGLVLPQFVPAAVP